MTLVQASESQSLVFSGFNCIHHSVSFFPGRSSPFFLFFVFLFFPQFSLSTFQSIFFKQLCALYRSCFFTPQTLSSDSHLLGSISNRPFPKMLLSSHWLAHRAAVSPTSPLLLLQIVSAPLLVTPDPRSSATGGLTPLLLFRSLRPLPCVHECWVPHPSATLNSLVFPLCMLSE